MLLNIYLTIGCAFAVLPLVYRPRTHQPLHLALVATAVIPFIWPYFIYKAIEHAVYLHRNDPD